MTRNYLAKLVFVIVALICISVPAAAENRPVQLSLFTPIQIFPENDTITGIRINLIYGRNASVTGLDWGLINHTTTGITKGWQIGTVGWVDSDFVGWQDNAVNVVKGNFKGFQWGIVNYANNAKGFQLGFVNYAESMYGLQIGFVNVIRQGGIFPVFPIVNWSF
jgi:hypothetical protein